MKYNYFEFIGAIVIIIMILSICGIGIKEIQQEAEYIDLPKQTWVEPEQEFDLNGKKCHMYYIYSGIKDPKLISRKQVIGRFVKCEDNSQPIKLEVNKGKFGWQ